MIYRWWIKTQKRCWTSLTFKEMQTVGGGLEMAGAGAPSALKASSEGQAEDALGHCDLHPWDLSRC